MSGFYWWVNISILLIELVVSTAITSIFISENLKIRRKAFSYIIMLGSIFILQDLVSIIFYYYFSLQYGSVLAIPLLIINLFGISALLLIYKILNF